MVFAFHLVQLATHRMAQIIAVDAPRREVVAVCARSDRLQGAEAVLRRTCAWGFARREGGACHRAEHTALRSSLPRPKLERTLPGGGLRPATRAAVARGPRTGNYRWGEALSLNGERKEERARASLTSVYRSSASRHREPRERARLKGYVAPTLGPAPALRRCCRPVGALCKAAAGAAAAREGDYPMTTRQTTSCPNWRRNGHEFKPLRSLADLARLNDTLRRAGDQELAGGPLSSHHNLKGAQAPFLACNAHRNQVGRRALSSGASGKPTRAPESASRSATLPNRHASTTASHHPLSPDAHWPQQRLARRNTRPGRRRPAP